MRQCIAGFINPHLYIRHVDALMVSNMENEKCLIFSEEDIKKLEQLRCTDPESALLIAQLLEKEVTTPLKQTKKIDFDKPDSFFEKFDKFRW